MSVEFENEWRIADAVLTVAERETIRRAALRELTTAFEGFDVRFAEGVVSPRVIRVEDTPYDMNGRRTFGAAGVTYPATTASSVRFDLLANALLAAAGCRGVDACGRSRAAMVAGLGHGVGATAAHELGHQAGFARFALDSPCADCFDGTSVAFDHFFGDKHWSPAALTIMKKTLPSLSGGEAR